MLTVATRPPGLDRRARYLRASSSFRACIARVFPADSQPAGTLQCHLCSIDGPFRHLSHWHAVPAALGTVLIPKPVS
jgi:hypothetical protein